MNPFFKNKDEFSKEELLAALAKAKEPSDISDIPKELAERLNLIKSDPHTEELVEIVKEAGGVSSSSKIKEALARKYGEECPTDSAINGRINKAREAGNLFSVDGTKGFYSVQPLSVRNSE
jgi:hypothetical protein